MSLRYEQKYIQNPHVFGGVSLVSNPRNFHEKNKYPSSLNNNYMLNSLNIRSGEKNYQSAILNNDGLKNQSQVSYARDFKHRLFEGDRNLQMKKQIQRQNYRKQLEEQMKADKDRKQKEKQKIEKQELERQKKFYLEVGKIKAQQPKKKQQPSYMILRSGKGHRNKHKGVQHSRINSVNDQIQQSQQIKMPKIIKRGGYHNEQSVNNVSFVKSQQPSNTPFVMNQEQFQVSQVQAKSMREKQMQQKQLQIVRERNYEEQRINNIIKLQQKMLRKLDYFKEQILRSHKHLELQKQVQHIRTLLKSKPIKLQVINIRDNELFQNYHDFYSFPKVNNQSRSRNRSRNRQNRSRVQEGYNLNYTQEKVLNKQLGDQNQGDQKYQRQNPQLYEGSNKREIKLFDNNRSYSVNDKNYGQGPQQQSQNETIQVPVLLQNKFYKNNKNQEQQSQQE